jgi:class 3 adenylate cyclase/ribosomal protein L40E
MRCPGCQSENPSDMSFCGKCGSPLARRCAKCGADNPPASNFCGKCGAVLTPNAPERSEGSSWEKPRGDVHVAERVRMQPASDSPTEGERKTVTALFADIKGSMELMEDLDPEEARAIVDPALKLMIDACHRYDGYIVQSTGDGIFALFGAPIAHEDHPQRALYAAMRMQADIGAYGDRLRQEGRAPIQIRVGVNTGDVVVRPLQTGESHVEYTPIGHSAGLAQRMQALARPDTIVASANTQKLAEGYFQFKPLGPARIKGVTEAIEIYEVAGLGALRTRLQVSARRGLSKFVGRDREIDAMKGALERAKAGYGQIVAAVGEPGVGKSRLFYEFRAMAQRGCLVLETFSVSHGKASAYMPVIDLLNNYFEIAAEDDERRRRQKIIGRILELDRALEDTLPYLFSLLGIQEGDSGLQQMAPEIMQRRTLEAIKRILLRESLNQPLILIFEDLHWLDAESEAFLNLVADGIPNASVLLMVNYRPEYRHEWGSKGYYMQLRLDPLGKESAGEMLDALLGEPIPSSAPSSPTPLPDQGEDARAARVRVTEGVDALKRLIIEKTEGNPFYMEEMVRALFDDGALVRNGGIKLTRGLGELRIPPTVQGILASRIDRLRPEEKELLQTLAIIGKEFPLALVRAVTGAQDGKLRGESGGDGNLDKMLTDLQLAEFIYEQPAFPDPEYTFKHALTQEVAYNSVLIERRKAIHERIGVALEKIFANRLDDHLSDLARHFSRSGNAEEAVKYLGLAASQATVRSAYSEATSLVKRALELLPAVAESERRVRNELRLQIALSASLSATKGFSDEEVGKAWSRACELARGLNDPILLFAVLQGLWGVHYTRGNINEQTAIATESMAIARQSGIRGLFKDAHRAMGASLANAGKLAEAREHLEQAISLSGAKRPDEGQIRYGPDTDVLCLTRLSDVLLEMGYPDQALKRAYEAVSLVKARSDPFSLAMALVQASQTHGFRREPTKCEEYARVAIALSTEHGFPFWLSVANRMVGWALTLQNRVPEGIEIITADLQQRVTMQTAMSRFQVLIALAEAYCKIDDLKPALAVLDEWSAIRQTLGLSSADSYFCRVRGVLMLKNGAADEAEKNFRQAISVAAHQGSKIRELQATTDLARLLLKRGRHEEARTMLAPIYAWFTEGFEIPDLKEAKALLDELNSHA